MQFFTWPKQPLTQKVIVGRPKLWWNANFHVAQATRKQWLSDARNCGEMQILCVLAQPSRHFVLVGRPKLWWNANFSVDGATLSSLRVGRTSETVAKRWFFYAVGDCRRHALISYNFTHAAVAKRAFWSFGWHAAVAKRAFWFCRMNPLVGFGGSVARNCGET